MKAYDIKKLTDELKSSDGAQYRNKIYYFVGGFGGRGYRKHMPTYDKSNLPYEDCWA